MADDYSMSDFVTPGQVKAQREMAEALLKQSMITPVGREHEAVSPFAIGTQMIQALTGRMGIDQAGQQERASEIGGQQARPEAAGGTYGGSSPMATTDTTAPVSAGAYAPLINDAASSFGVPSEFLTNQIGAESSFRPNARGTKGEIGLAQFMPATAAQYGVNPADPKSAIMGAAHYDSDLTKQFGGNVGLGLAAYNWGPGNVRKWLASGANPAAVPAITRAYVQKITGKPLEAWLATKGADQGASSAQPSPTNGQALAFSREPAPAPAEPPGSPAAMSNALAGTEVAAGRAVPVGVSTARPGGGIAPGLVPTRPHMTKQQFDRAYLSADPEARRLLELQYYQQNQPQVVKDRFGRDVVIGPDGSQMLINPPVWKEPDVKGIKTPVPLIQTPEGTGFTRMPTTGGAAGAPAAPAPTPDEDVPDLKFAPGEKGAISGEEAPAEILKGPEAAKAERAGGMLGTKPPKGAPEGEISALPFAKVAEGAPGTGGRSLMDMPPEEQYKWVQDQENKQKATQGQNQANINESMKANKALQDVARVSLGNRTFVDLGTKLVQDPRLQALLGPGANLKTDWNSMMALLGSKDANLAAGLRNTFDKTIASAIIGTLKSDYGGLGQIRNKEIELSNKATFSPDNTVEANLAVLEIARKTIERNKALGQIANAYMQGQRWDKNGKKLPGTSEEVPSFAGLSKVVNEYLDNHQIFDEKVKDKDGKTEMDRMIGLFEKPDAKEGKTPPSGGRAPPSREQIDKAFERRQGKPATFDERFKP